MQSVSCCNYHSMQSVSCCNYHKANVETNFCRRWNGKKDWKVSYYVDLERLKGFILCWLRKTERLHIVLTSASLLFNPWTCSILLKLRKVEIQVAKCGKCTSTASSTFCSQWLLSNQNLSSLDKLTLEEIWTPRQERCQVVLNVVIMFWPY